MSFIGRSIVRRGWPGLTAAVLVVLVAGCGAVKPGGSAAPVPAGAGSASEVSVPEDELQKTVDQALSTGDIKASTLPPLMRDALARASRTLTPAQIDKAYECWKATSCTLGNGPLTLGQADPFGGNTWRQFTKMNVILQALTHPEIGKYIYTDANLDLATYQANLRTLTAQGAKAIITINEFGPAAYTALATARRQGAAVSTYLGDMENAPANAYTTRVQYDLCATGKAMAETVQKAVAAKGPIAYFDGLAGNPQDAKVKACVADAGVDTVFNEATDYTAAGTQRAASALIASGKPAKAILYSYANTVPSIVNAYRAAGKDVPAIITTTESNAAACQRAEKPYPLFFTNSANWSARIAVDASVRAAGGEKVADSVVFPLPFFEVTDSDCDKSKPAEYPGPALVPDVLTDKMLAAR
ncbi:substrate-binding domain-containing protein [Amycolatopsis pithecellobii]|uniref:Substrate-binding domain-containing protein n=1 Tax=Amycolatopsis pithecellobii TaxID=664692 RepID=A0A6N7Z202_9PSEU|nr:substrate-binding domain-containing protein [Amycolatopsis pithecellobii]MTD55563.1 substrate-binding domain-containing protein [Amycolatopsis pithecellobii]